MPPNDDSLLERRVEIAPASPRVTSLWLRPDGSSVDKYVWRVCVRVCVCACGAFFHITPKLFQTASFEPSTRLEVHEKATSILAATCTTRTSCAPRGTFCDVCRIGYLFGRLNRRMAALHQSPGQMILRHRLEGYASSCVYPPLYHHLPFTPVSSYPCTL